MLFSVIHMMPIIKYYLAALQQIFSVFIKDYQEYHFQENFWLP